MYEYVTKELDYSEGAAHRRISSMRLLQDLPNLESHVRSGSLSLSVVAQAQSFFRNENIKKPEAKREILLGLQGCSRREAERELASKAIVPELHIPEKARAVSKTHTELTLTVDDEFMAKLEELRCLLAGQNPFISTKEILFIALDDSLKSRRPKPPKARPPQESKNSGVNKFSDVERNRGKETVSGKEITFVIKPREENGEAEPMRAVSINPPPPAEVEVATRLNTEQEISKRSQNVPPNIKRSRYIPPQIKRAVYARDQGMCTYSDPQTGRACSSKFQLEFDHIHPFAEGGSNTIENLRLRCRAHNQLRTRH